MDREMDGQMDNGETICPRSFTTGAKNVSNGTSTHEGEQLCKFILKSLTLGISGLVFQMAHLHVMENDSVKLF